VHVQVKALLQEMANFEDAEPINTYQSMYDMVKRRSNKEREKEGLMKAMESRAKSLNQLAQVRSSVSAISQLPKLCMKITIFMQGHVLIADRSVAHFIVIMNDVMNDNMAAFAHAGTRLGAFFYWTRFLENNVLFDNIPL